MLPAWSRRACSGGSPAWLRGTTEIISLSRLIWKLWSLTVTVTILRAWIIPTWMRWVATMIEPRSETRRSPRSPAAAKPASRTRALIMTARKSPVKPIAEFLTSIRRYTLGISAGRGYRTSSPVTARPISIRWISEVHSKMVKIVDYGAVSAVQRPALPCGISTDSAPAVRGQ